MQTDRQKETKTHSDKETETYRQTETEREWREESRTPAMQLSPFYILLRKQREIEK